MLLKKFIHVFCHKSSIFIISQSVIEHSQTLVPPESNKTGRTVKSLRNGYSQSMIDTRQVSEIKDIVKL